MLCAAGWKAGGNPGCSDPLVGFGCLRRGGRTEPGLGPPAGVPEVLLPPSMKMGASDLKSGAGWDLASCLFCCLAAPLLLMPLAGSCLTPLSTPPELPWASVMLAQGKPFHQGGRGEM